MTEKFDELYEISKQGTSHKHLYDTIVTRENILLAYRTIKNNKGSKTAGSDGRTIKDFQDWNEDKFVRFIQKCRYTMKTDPLLSLKIDPPRYYI